MSFPFSAVVGHDDLRLALLLTAVDPAVGGVLVRGEKGTAKSTVVRALAALLPDVEVVVGDRFNVDPAAAAESPDGPFPADAPVRVRPARLVELPVGASEDRLIGSLDLAQVLGGGAGNGDGAGAARAVSPGLLAAAHRGVLYVDEVNLLHDHLVDLLLDAAASGRAHVERDGVSLTHPASFLLVGTMNPEEGELRPQLLDRFGLTVHVAASRDVGERTEVVRRRLAHDADPDAFAARFAPDEAALRERLAAARALRPAVALPDAELVRISAVCAAVDVDGMRADVVLARTAIAHAAWRGAEAVDESDVRAAARLALPHRRRRDPFDEPHLSDEELDEALRGADDEVRAQAPPEGDAGDGGADGDGPGPDDRGQDGGPGDRGPDGGPGDGGPGGGGPGGGGPGGGGPGGGSPPSGPTDGRDGSGARDDGAGAPSGPGGDGAGSRGPGAARGAGPDGDPDAGPGGDPDRAPTTPVGAPMSTRLRARRLEVAGTGEGAPGRRSRARGRHGRTVRAVAEVPSGGPSVHVPATVLAAARRRRPGGALRVNTSDVRHAVREGREGNLVLFCVDASGSMAARRRMTAVTGAAAALLRDAYQRRDKVGVVVFRGGLDGGAEVVLPPTTSAHTAHARLHDLRTGGRTPLAAGLRTARRLLATERVRDPRRRGLLVLLTDGRATATTGAVATPGGAATPLDAALAAAGGLARDAARGPRGGAAMSTVVVDCESGPVRLGLAGRVAAAAGGTLVRLDELTGESVAGVVGAALAASPR